MADTLTWHNYTVIWIKIVAKGNHQMAPHSRTITEIATGIRTAVRHNRKYTATRSESYFKHARHGMQVWSSQTDINQDAYAYTYLLLAHQCTLDNLLKLHATMPDVWTNNKNAVWWHARRWLGKQKVSTQLTAIYKTVHEYLCSFEYATSICFPI